MFLTRFGNRWVRMSDADVPEKRVHLDSVGPEFSKVMKSLGLNGRRNFYSLRHTFETVGDESRDRVAVDRIMGHTDPSMAANYRHRISDERLQDVVNFVHTWLWPPENDTGEDTTHIVKMNAVVDTQLCTTRTSY